MSFKQYYTTLGRHNHGARVHIQAGCDKVILRETKRFEFKHVKTNQSDSIFSPRETKTYLAHREEPDSRRFQPKPARNAKQDVRNKKSQRKEMTSELKNQECVSLEQMKPRSSTSRDTNVKKRLIKIPM